MSCLAPRHGCWDGIGDTFVVPSATYPTLHVLDFAAQPSAACWFGSKGGSNGRGGGGEYAAGRVEGPLGQRRNVKLRIEGRASCVAVHPVTQEVLWGGGDGALHMLDVPE